MSIFNPWGEVRTLKAALAAHKAVQKAVEQEMQAQLDELTARLASLKDAELKIGRLELANKRRAATIKRRDEVIKYYKKRARELLNKYRAASDHGAADYSMGKLKVMCTQLKLENIELKKQLAGSVRRDPKTGRLLPKGK